MKAEKAITKKQQSKFLSFRRKIYRQRGLYVDNNYFMIKQIFTRSISVVRSMLIEPVNILDDNGGVLCQGIIVVADGLKDYVQLCFFEALPGDHEAVELLVRTAEDTGKKNGCRRLVTGLNGHVNYGLGILSSHFEDKNSFSSPGNPGFYNEYFKEPDYERVGLNSYYAGSLKGKLDRYAALLKKLYREYQFKAFDKKDFDRYLKLYTDLNNECFKDHRYYYERCCKDDGEMLRELFMFMKEDSIIFAFKSDDPAGFIMWYPDYNMLAKPGEAFGVKHFFANALKGARIDTAKVMEYGVREKYRGSGLALALIGKVYETLLSYGIDKVETSWILAENEDSDSFCRALCDERYKEYSVYEKDIR